MKVIWLLLGLGWHVYAILFWFNGDYNGFRECVAIGLLAFVRAEQHEKDDA